ncbi:putative Zn(2)-C6 fungal-type domain-containing protein [Seiridium unicorne]|uniref:Zn(2)-C6 fungal-type domain-containing protein n=1 Tax=Seiridium unicorne TaxID=138068 RepID=A0ABR2VJ44_9PEZI
MFLSWKPGEGSSLNQRPMAFDPATAKTAGPQACTNCRARKGRKCNYESANSKFKNGRRRSKEDGVGNSANTGDGGNGQKPVSDQDGENNVSESSAAAAGTAGTTMTPNTASRASSKSKPARKSSTNTERKEADTNSSTSYMDETREPTPIRNDHEAEVPEVDHLPDNLSLDDSFPDAMGSPMITSHDLDAGSMPLLSQLDSSLFFTDMDPLNVFSSASSSSFVEHTDDSLFSASLGSSADESLRKTLGPGSKPEYDLTMGDLVAGSASGPVSGIMADGSSSLTAGCLAGSGSGSESLALRLLGSGRSSLSCSPDGSTCQCLHSLVILVDELESVVDNGITSLDGALATHKEALSYGVKMTGCAGCTARVENMTILTFMIHKLARICRYIADACAFTAISPRRQSAVMDRGGSRQLIHPHAMSNVGVGVYHVDSSDEYAAIGIAERLQSDTMSRRLAACEEATTGILREL